MTISFETTLERTVFGSELEIDVEVEASFSRRRAATYWQPAEGGFEELQAYVTIRKRRVEMVLTDLEYRRLAELAEEHSMDAEDEPEYEPPDYDDRPGYDE